MKVLSSIDAKKEITKTMDEVMCKKITVLLRLSNVQNIPYAAYKCETLMSGL